MSGLMQPNKRQDVTMILGKLKDSSTSENSSEALKEANEQSMQKLSGEEDIIDASTAQEAAATSLMSALESKNTKAIASAIVDFIKLTNLEHEQLEEISGED
jgi:uncharacterized protein